MAKGAAGPTADSTGDSLKQSGQVKAEVPRGKVRLGSGMGANSAPAEVVKEIKRGASMDALLNDLKANAWVSGKEHALIKLKDGRRLMIRGGEDGIDFYEVNGKIMMTVDGQLVEIERIFIHTHPAPSGRSDLDMEHLRKLGQASSWLFEFKGGLSKFFR